MIEAFLDRHVALINEQEVPQISFSKALPKSHTAKLTLSFLRLWYEISLSLSVAVLSFLTQKLLNGFVG